MSWTITYFNESVQQEILATCPQAILAGIFDTQTGWRCLALTMVGKKIMVLHQFMKKTDKTPPRELETARRRMKEVKNAHT